MACKAKPSKRTRAPRKVAGFHETDLTTGQLRKLNALCKSVGDKIGTRAFAQWLAASSKSKARGPVDKNAEMIVGALGPLAREGKLRIPRGGYLVTRGRGREIVNRAKG